MGNKSNNTKKNVFFNSFLLFVLGFASSIQYSPSPRNRKKEMEKQKKNKKEKERKRKKKKEKERKRKKKKEKERKRNGNKIKPRGGRIQFEVTTLHVYLSTPTL